MTALGIATVLAWVVLVVAAWIGYLLIRNNREMDESFTTLENALEEVEEKVETEKRQAAGLPFGTPAPPFELPDLDGKRVTLEQFRGRRVLLLFFSPECGYCKALAPDLARVSRDASAGQPMPVVVTTGELEANRAFVAEHGIRCPVLMQFGTEVSTSYKVPGTPVGYLIDESGAIASRMAAGGQNILALAQGPTVTVEGSVEESPESAQITVGTGEAPAGRAKRRVGGLDPGSVAPRFTLPLLDGGRLSLDDYRGRRLFLVFSDPDCEACDRIMPELEQIHRHAPALPIVMVSRGEPDRNRLKVADLGLTFPVVLQRRWDLSRQYRKFATPAAYLIDENGLIASKVAAGGALLGLALEAAGAAPAGREAGLQKARA